MIFHTFLFSISPILSLWVGNIDELSFVRTVPLMVFALLVGGVFFLIFRFVFKTWDKAAVLGSVTVLLFFSFGHVHDAILALGKGVFVVQFSHLLLIWAVIFIFTAYRVWKTQSDLRTINSGFTIIAFVLILIPIITLADASISSYITNSNGQNEDLKETIIVNSQVKELPDVYYIVLDQYASEWALKKFYDYDNGDFLKFLEDYSFYIADKSTSNYYVTRFTLRSALNMDYLKNLSSLDNKIGSNELIKNHLVGRTFKDLGYKYVHFGSAWEITAYNPYADININKNSLSESLQTIYRKTALYPIAYIIGVNSWLTHRIEGDMQWNRILYQLDQLEEVPKIDEPTFTFVHFGVPHAPFVFNSDGSPNKKHTPPSVDRNHDPDSYLNQLIFITERIKQVVEKILAESEKPPIIVLQSDHGSKSFSIKDIDSIALIDDDVLRDYFRNFSAYHFPEDGSTLLYENITPVNLFRIIFNYYFGVDLDLLPDVNYMSLNEDESEFFDVTQRVAY